MAFVYRHMGYVGYVDRKFTCTDTCTDTRTPDVPDNYGPRHGWQDRLWDKLLPHAGTAPKAKVNAKAKEKRQNGPPKLDSN